eukprot:145253-Amphidinium_carterae.1
MESMANTADMPMFCCAQQVISRRHLGAKVSVATLNLLATIHFANGGTKYIWSQRRVDAQPRLIANKLNIEAV